MHMEQTMSWQSATLALITGNIGKSFSGVYPLRGQNNVQGSCDMGSLPDVYPGYQTVNDPEVSAKFEKSGVLIKHI